MPAEKNDQEWQRLVSTRESHGRHNSHDQSVEADILDNHNLCSQCSRIDFETIFNSEMSRTGSYIAAHLGYRTSAWEKSACSVCRLFATVRVPPLTIGPDGGSDYHLRAVSFFEATPEALLNTSTQNLASFDKACLIVMPKNGQQFTPEVLKEALTQRKFKGVLCRVETSNCEASSSFGVRMVEPKFINYQLLRGWIDICQQHHYSSCFFEESKLIASFRVIDCETRLVVEATSRLPYVALSYVWGSRPFQASGNLRTGVCVPDVLPDVIEDAITVTLRLGWRYLWVDRLCIDQENDADKHGQIGQMDKIYSGASTTLVAAAGLDADFGLPGVGKTSRMPQSFAIVRGQLLASTMRSPEILTSHSKWATRAWTYQEAVLSTRRLVFTEEQVYFECSCMHCCESVVDPLNLPINQIQNNEEFRSQMRIGYSGSYAGVGQNPDQEESLKVISQIRDHVKCFTARQLSYESDSLHAFLGILNQYGKGSAPINHCWGLPVNYPGIAQTPLAFVINLCWQHPLSLNENPPQRREELPSFSWAGWSGVALLPNWSPWGVEMLATVNKALQPSAMRSFLLEQVTKEIAGRPSPSYYLKMDVNMVKVQLCYIPTSNPKSHTFWLVDKRKGIRIPAILSKQPFKGDEYFERLRTRPCDCLIIAGKGSLLEDITNSTENVYLGYLWSCLLLVEQYGDIYERIGVISDRDLFRYYGTGASIPMTRRRIWLG